MCPPALYRLCLAILYVRLPALGCCGRLCLAILCLPALDVASSSFDFEKHKLFGVYGGVIFPRVRTPCGHGAQVIVEGREEQTDGGERNKDPKTNPNQTPSPQAETPPSCSLSSTLGETCETETSGN